MSCESETIDVLRESGHKMTPQRMMILTSLRHAPGHLSAADIYERVKADYPYVDISTVYRTLTVLKDMHLISETHMGSGDATFEWVGVERHHHLICRKCSGVTQLDHRYLEDLGTQLAADLGFRADIDHFAIFGLCKGCQHDLNQQVK
ncbi:MAG TPA: transcriptional repressor [Dehalococcoidia bacterium]|jgi:Fur family ferric uptake transcriptional regulator